MRNLNDVIEALESASRILDSGADQWEAFGAPLAARRLKLEARALRGLRARLQNAVVAAKAEMGRKE